MLINDEYEYFGEGALKSQIRLRQHIQTHTQTYRKAEMHKNTLLSIEFTHVKMALQKSKSQHCLTQVQMALHESKWPHTSQNGLTQVKRALIPTQTEKVSNERETRNEKKRLNNFRNCRLRLESEFGSTIL